METFLHIFSPLDISGAMIQALAAVLNPLLHGFQHILSPLLPGLKKLIEIYPGFVSGALLVSILYGGYSILMRNRLKRILIKK
jgi:hypothetical protein